jgi:hypothetical protein
MSLWTLTRRLRRRLVAGLLVVLTAAVVPAAVVSFLAGCKCKTVG